MKEVQKLLKPQDSRLKRLGPGNARRTIILFVVPHILGKTLKDQANWWNIGIRRLLSLFLRYQKKCSMRKRQMQRSNETNNNDCNTLDLSLFP